MLQLVVPQLAHLYLLMVFNYSFFTFINLYLLFIFIHLFNYDIESVVIRVTVVVRGEPDGFNVTLHSESISNNLEFENEVNSNINRGEKRAGIFLISFYIHFIY